MTDGPQLETVVADTSALVSLGVARADEHYDTDAGPDPLQYLLTSCDVSVPPTVVSELQELTQYRDIHGAAATNILAAQDYYRIDDPYEMDATSTSRPNFGLDDGETDGIVLANAFGVDGFLTDEFGGTNFALIHASLRGPRLVTVPRIICDYARNGHLSTEEAQPLVSVIGDHRSWDRSRYVARLLDKLE